MPRRVPNLHEVLDDLCERHLGRTLDVEIEWGFPSWFGDAVQASVGWDEEHELVITVDHALSLPWVPLYYVRDVVWHEACHFVLHELTGEWHADHGSIFRVLESLHSDRLRAATWEAGNRDRIRSAIDRLRKRRIH